MEIWIDAFACLYLYFIGNKHYNLHTKFGCPWAWGHKSFVCVFFASPFFLHRNLTIAALQLIGNIMKKSKNDQTLAEPYA
jgi:hypothetical protein